MKAFPDRCRFNITNSVSGEPDAVISLAGITFRAEFKYTGNKFQSFRSLNQIWEMLRGIQKKTIINMVLAGELVYVVVCCAGIEAPWFRVDYTQLKKCMAGQAPIFSCLALERLSVRWGNGRWTSGLDWGDDMPEKKTVGELAKKMLTLPRHLLTRNK